MRASDECAGCGLVPFDLPDGIDAEAVFEYDDRSRAWYCQGCLPADTPEGEKP